jgi:predicted  nucleic acid-binding Zn-ribbon protein
MKTKDEYIESLATELKDWSAQIDVLSAKMEKAAGMVKLKYIEDVNSLHTKQQAASEKIKELEDASAEAWDAAKGTADKIWDELRVGLASATSKFR